MHVVRVATAVYLGAQLAVWGVLVCASVASQSAIAAPTARPCEAPGQDCVDYLRQGGPASFCAWAASMASLGAYQRAEGAPRVVPRVQFPRALTEQEQAEIRRWFSIGYDSGLDSYRARERAYTACLGHST